MPVRRRPTADVAAPITPSLNSPPGGQLLSTVRWTTLNHFVVSAEADSPEPAVTKWPSTCVKLVISGRAKTALLAPDAMIDALLGRLRGSQPEGARRHEGPRGLLRHLRPGGWPHQRPQGAWRTSWRSWYPCGGGPRRTLRLLPYPARTLHQGASHYRQHEHEGRRPTFPWTAPMRTPSSPWRRRRPAHAWCARRASGRRRRPWRQAW